MTWSTSDPTGTPCISGTNTVDPYYGTSFYTIDFSGEHPLIRRKTIVLKNDYIHHVVDVYHF